MVKENVPELSKKEFDDFVSKGFVLIDFYGEWCMPCLMMAPIIEEMSEKLKGKLKFGKVNIDDSPELADKFGVNSIPNFVLFKDGKKMSQFVGGMPAEELEERLNGIIG